MNEKKLLIERIRDTNITEKTFINYKEDICDYNLKILQQVSFVGSIIGLILVILSLLPLGILKLLYGYISIAIMFLVVFILSRTVLNKHRKLVLPVYYILMVVFLFIGILMGTIMGNKTNATTFIMLILTLPLFIVDRPRRLYLVFGIMSVIFCIADYNLKAGILSRVDITNCIVFYVLSIVISRQVIYTKVSDIIIKRELKKQLDMDMLTKLGNRTSLERIVAQYVYDSKEDAVMIIMDLDNFKTVNDMMGHAYGDEVLQIVGAYLKGAFRKTDVVSRLGGDEFMIFLPYVDEIDVITQKLQLLIEHIKEIPIDPKSECHVGSSFGISKYPQDGADFETLYKKADIALYQAKNNGKNCFAIYKENIDDKKMDPKMDKKNC